MAAKRMLSTAGLLVALVLPATATAARSTRAPAHVAVQAKAPTTLAAVTWVGERYWRAVPCGGKVTVVAKQSLAAGADPATDAWVTFDSSMGANNLAAPAASYTNCTIALARWRWPTATSMRDDWDMLCATMAHEMGHLLGHVHDATPGSIMAPVFTDASSVPELCRAMRPAV
jgi:predicted nucleic acid-binding Zn ribbon protein